MTTQQLSGAACDSGRRHMIATHRTHLHREAVAAMWLFGEQYAAQPKGALDFWAELPKHQRDTCREFVETVIAAGPTTEAHRANLESARTAPEKL